MEIYNEMEKAAAFLASEQAQPFLIGVWAFALGVVFTLIAQGKGSNPSGVGAC